MQTANEIVKAQRAVVDIRYMAEECDRTNNGCQWRKHLLEYAALIEQQQAEIEMLKKLQPVTLSTEAADAFVLAAELSEVKQDLAALREAGRWIPVSERLPEVPDTSGVHGVLVVDFTGKSSINFIETVRAFPNWFTHWMPLPEAPEQEGEQKHD